jgi:glycosyltransferase involved in cell wall biosynthesis
MTEDMKVLMVTSSLAGAGAGNHILNLCRYLKSVAVDVEVMTISAGRHELEDLLESDGVAIRRLPLGSLRDLVRPRKITDLRRCMAEAGPGIIHGHLYHGELVAAFASLMAGVPMVTTRHSSGLEFNGLRRLPARLCAARIGAAIAVSRGAAREAESTGIPRRKIWIIPNGVDTRRFRALDASEKLECKRQLVRELFPGDVPSDPLLIGAAGALKRVKNHALMIRAASRILAADPSLTDRLRFVIAGEGGMREELERQLLQEGLEGVFALPGYLHGLDDYLPCLDIFVMTSVSEGLPIALLEAMSSGAACVASDTGDIAELIADTGYAPAVGDEEGFVMALSRLVSDANQRGALGRRARVRILEHYDMEIWGDRTVGVYRSLLHAP